MLDLMGEDSALSGDPALGHIALFTLAGLVVLCRISRTVQAAPLAAID
jgi:hypothetical protein